MMSSKYVFNGEYERRSIFIDLSLLRFKFAIYGISHEKMKVQVKSFCRETTY